MATAAPKTTGTLGNYWLVKTGAGANSSAEIQNLPKGQKPLLAGQGGAVYLGATVKQANAAVHAAAEKLKVPDPQIVPSLATSLGIITAIAGGFTLGGAGAAAATDAIGADTAATAATGAGTSAATTAVEGGASGAATSAATGVLSKLAGGALITGLVAAYGKRLLEVIAGGVLIIIGLFVIVRKQLPSPV